MRLVKSVFARITDSQQTSRHVRFVRWSQPVDATLYLKGEMECALMGRRFHRGFTAAEKTELWDRWKRGECCVDRLSRRAGTSSADMRWTGRHVKFVLLCAQCWLSTCLVWRRDA